MLPMKEKRCFKCGKIKPIDEFYKHSQMKDGHLNKCKECTKKDVRKRETTSPDAILKTRLSICEKSPTKYNAHKAVEAAIKAGVIRKPDCCFGCGRSAEETRLGTHHHDYEKPLDVVWVCARCHRQLDANLRARKGLSPFGKGKAVKMLKDGECIATFSTIKEASVITGQSVSAIRDCADGKTKNRKGFSWRYVPVVKNE